MPITPAQDEEDPIQAQLIADVQKAIGVAGSQIDVTAAQTQQDVAKTRELTNQISSNLEKAAVNEQTIKNAELTGELERQNANVAILEASGGQTAQAITLAELQAEEDEIDRLVNERTEIFNREHTGLGAIDFIINAFGSIPNAIDTNFAKDERDQTLTEIANITGAQESFARVNAHTKKTLNDDAIQANLENTALLNQIEANKQSISNIHTNARAMGNLVNMRTEQVSAARKLVQFDLEKEQFKIRKQAQELQRQQMDITLKELEVRIPKLKIDLERGKINLEQAQRLERSLDTQAIAVQRGQSAVRGPNNVDSLDVIKQDLLSGGQLAAKAVQFRNIGATENASYGGTASEAMETLALVDPNNTAPRTKGIQLLNQIKLAVNEDFAANAAKGIKPPTKPEQIAAAIDSKANQTMATFASNIVPGQANPYSAPPMETMAPFLETKGITLYNKILKPMGMKEIEPQRIVDAAIAGIQAKTITPEQAADGITKFFETVAMYNNYDGGGLTRVGLPPQTSYNTAIEFPVSIQQVTAAFTPFAEPKGEPDLGVVGVTSGLLNAPTRIVDLMNEVQVQQMVIRNMGVSKPVNPAAPTNTPNQPAPKTIQSQEE